MCLAKVGLMEALEEGPCEKAGLEVVICHSRSVGAKFGMDRGNASRRKSGAKHVM